LVSALTLDASAWPGCSGEPLKVKVRLLEARFAQLGLGTPASVSSVTRNPSAVLEGSSAKRPRRETAAEPDEQIASNFKRL
jgi:hypothetical protein